MTTELTLRDKVLDVMGLYGSDWGKMDAAYIVNAIADLLSATGDPAYIRVADDLRGVVREEAFDAAEYFAARNWKDDLDQLSESEWGDLRMKMIARMRCR